MKRIFALLLLMMAVSAAASAQNNAQALTAGESKQAELSLEEQAKIGEIGTAGDNPFLIATAEQLKELATLVNAEKTYNDGNGSYGAAHYRMVADVDLSAYGNWTPIGSEDTPFRGTFEGNSHTIRNLTITNATQEYQGLFGWANGIIQNVLVSDANISVTYTNAAVGTIVGRNDGIVQNCAMLGGAVRGNVYVGGIAGCNISMGTVQNCYATGSVTGTGNNAGGVAGIANGKTENCVALGVVVSDATNVNRVVGAGGSEGLKNNYAWSGMKANGRIVTDGQADNKNGEDILASGGLLYDKNGQIFAWSGFDASVWELRNTEAGRLPSLRMGGDPTMPLEVQRAEVRCAVNLTAGTGVSGFRYKVNDAADFTVYSPDLTVALADKLEIEPILQRNYAFAQWSDGRMNAVYTVDSARRKIELTASANAVEYAIAYELGGGALKEGETNPETYTVETETFTLNNPIREGYIFTGWTGSNGTTPGLTVKIEQGTTGELEFTANWTTKEKPTPTLKVESSASLVVGMATENVIVRIGEGVPNFGAANFKSVDLDGKPIDPKFYQVRDGSIILTIDRAFLNTLSVGEHTLNVQLRGDGYEGQTVFVQITVSPVPDVSRLPKTGDDSPILLWGAAFGACAAGLAAMLARKKKK